MVENSIIDVLSFYFHKTPVVTIAVLLTLVTIIISLGLFVYILLFRIKSFFNEKKRKKNYNLWSQQLFAFLDADSSSSDLKFNIRNKDIDMFIEFLFYYLENIKGEDAKKIRGIFKGMGLLDRELEFLTHSKNLWRRSLAAFRLGQVKAPEAKEALIESLSDESDLVSYTASAALMKIGDRESIGKILGILLAQEDLSGELFAEIILGYGSDVVSEVSQALSIYNELPRSRTKIIDFLGHYRRVEIAPFLISLLTTSENAEEKIHVIKALGNLIEPKSFPALVSCLKNSNPTIRSQAAKALGYFKDEAAFDELAELLSDKDWWCRYHAALAIFKTGESGKLFLKKLYKETKDPFARDVIQQLMVVS